MHCGKPLYPPPWWNPVKPPSDICDFGKGEEFIVRYIGCDCDGNALFCLKRKPEPCEIPPNPCRKPRFFDYR